MRLTIVTTMLLFLSACVDHKAIMEKAEDMCEKKPTTITVQTGTLQSSVSVSCTFENGIE